jgi:hypothetical protein
MAAMRIQKIIDAICNDCSSEDTVLWNREDKRLCWTWVNERNLQEWTLRLAEVKRDGFDKSNPQDHVRMSFLFGKITAFQAKEQIDRLEGLKAFW